jgi:hypothetical protein
MTTPTLLTQAGSPKRRYATAADVEQIDRSAGRSFRKREPATRVRGWRQKGGLGRGHSWTNKDLVTPRSDRLLRKQRAMSTTSAHAIQVASDDPYDRPYRFAQPLNYLSPREQARLLILRGRLHGRPRAELRLCAARVRN